jgi:phosphatidylserine/phosphatidylglycerophosphate/cardiolipin synthase-like enzyme
MRKPTCGALSGRGGSIPLLAVLALLISGCATLPRHVEKTPSVALKDPDTTSLGRIVAAEEGGKNLSGIRLLTSGEEALADLIALADHAQRTLDVQYYIIHQDDSARILLHHVRLAADRGVRVRVLVDDLNTAGEDRRFMHLGEHANVEVRVFNPFPGGRSATWTRLLASVNDIPRINHRMHEEVTIANNLAVLMRSAQQELIVISPYFVPGKDGVALFAKLVDQGVHIRILTNSLASTDSPLVHDGYSRYRVALLKLGIELSEVRPKLGQKRARFHPFRSSTASLHAKALVIDQKTVFIGSMNMDARSARTNSELGLVIRSADIARQVTSLLDDISADGSYKLQLVNHTNRIAWSSGEPGSEKTWYTDPETTHLQRFVLKVLAPFAPEELL